LLQRASGDIPHDHVREAAMLIDGVDGDDVFVDDGGGGLRFAGEPLAGGGARRQVRRGGLQRHEPVEGRLGRLEDDPRPAAPGQPRPTRPAISYGPIRPSIAGSSVGARNSSESVSDRSSSGSSAGVDRAIPTKPSGNGAFSPRPRKRRASLHQAASPAAVSSS